METISELDINNTAHADEWDRFVEKHPYGWITHLSSWKRVLEESFSHIRGHIITINDDHKIVAGMPIYEVKSIFTGKRLVSIPFATLSDPLVHKIEHLKILTDYSDHFRKAGGYRYIEIRTKEATSFVNQLGLKPYRNFKYHYLLLQRRHDQLIKSFHVSCVQRKLKKLTDNYLSLKIATSEHDFNEFYLLYVNTRKKVGFPPFPEKYLNNISREFCSKGQGKIYLAKYKGITVAGLLLLKYKNRVSVEIQCSDERFLKMSPNHFLYWEAIKEAKKEGYEIFDFGRTDPFNTGLMRFKDQWGTQVNDLMIFTLPEQSRQKTIQRYDSFKYRITRKIAKITPASLFIRLGSILYRHRS